MNTWVQKTKIQKATLWGREFLEGWHIYSATYRFFIKDPTCGWIWICEMSGFFFHPSVPERLKKFAKISPFSLDDKRNVMTWKMAEMEWKSTKSHASVLWTNQIASCQVSLFILDRFTFLSKVIRNSLHKYNMLTNFTCNSIFNAIFSRIAIGLIPVLVRPLTVNNTFFSLHNLRKHRNRRRFSMDCLLKHDGPFLFNTVSGIWLPICLTSRNQKRVNSSIGM